ncbi:MAG: hypothetical protein ACYC7E_11310 [Armatimonadota bacterium]
MNEVTIPVWIDDVKSYADFSFSRCVYFTIECEHPSTGWMLGLQQRKIPFAMLGLTGVIHAPVKGDTFTSLDDLDQLIQAIEAHDVLTVGTADIWLPNEILLNLSNHDTRAARRQVYRLGEKLFSYAYLFRMDRLSQHEFYQWCRELRSLIIFSEQETETFRAWMDRQIILARERYPKNEEFALQWSEIDGPEQQWRKE